MTALTRFQGDVVAPTFTQAQKISEDVTCVLCVGGEDESRKLCTDGDQAQHHQGGDCPFSALLQPHLESCLPFSAPQ